MVEYKYGRGYTFYSDANLLDTGSERTGIFDVSKL